MIFNRHALAAARRKAGLSKSQLADQSGHSRPYITQVESGERLNPSRQAIEKWAEVCEVDDPRALYVEPTVDELLRALTAARNAEHEAGAA